MGGVLKGREEAAVGKFMVGYNCAQAVCYASCDELGLDRDKALKLACGFGAGMGRRGEVCGAVTGGIIVLGLKYGRGENDDRDAMEAAYARTSELMKRFAEKHGSYICRDLIGGCDLMTENGQQEFRERNLLHEVCVPCVRSVVEILGCLG